VTDGPFLRLFYNYLSSLPLFSLLSKNINIKIYRNIISPVVFVWVGNLVAHIEGGTQDDGV
jgi:hypothetical protein